MSGLWPPSHPLGLLLHALATSGRADAERWSRATPPFPRRKVREEHGESLEGQRKGLERRLRQEAEARVAALAALRGELAAEAAIAVRPLLSLDSFPVSKSASSSSDSSTRCMFPYLHLGLNG